MTLPLPAPIRPRLSRRAFLKLSGAAVAGWGLAPALAAPSLAATLPVPFPHRYFSDPDTLLTRPLDGFDLLLVPAYIAAGLIRRGRLQPLAGPRGRAHDPEGAYTRPYRHAATAVVYPAGTTPSDPWQRSLAWPAAGRLLFGAALQRRGYSPNDTHAGRLAQAGQDVAALRPDLSADPLAALAAGTAPAAFVPVPLTDNGELELAEGLEAALPPWGGVLLEYDWVMPASAPNPEAALAFLQALPPAVAAPTLPLVPLAPLPDRAQAQHARLWADLTRPRRQAAG